VDDDVDQPIPTVPKPDALLALHDVTAELFATLRRWFAVPPEVAIDLREIDSAVGELGDPLMIAALAMRKLQALHLLATPGVMTTTDVVVTIVQDLDRALVQAPNMHLKLQAAATDWDAELAHLGDVHEPLARVDDRWTDGGPTTDEWEPDEHDPDDPDRDELVDGELRDEDLIDELLDELTALDAGHDTSFDPGTEGGRRDHPARRPDPGAPVDPNQADPETERFRLLHARLHEAAYAVIELSEGEIRYLV
jgi:hypothetical protein